MVSRIHKAAVSACVAAYSTILACSHILTKRRKRARRSHHSAYHTRRGLLHPRYIHQPTPWQQILLHGTDQDFIITTNFTISLLLNDMLPLFSNARTQSTFNSPYRRTHSSQGRKPLLQSVDLLGMALYYLKSSSKAYQLCPLFGVVPSSLGVWLDYALHVLLKATKADKQDRLGVRWPSFDEQKEFAALLENNRHFGTLLKGVFAVTDAGRFKCQEYGDRHLQNAYYEGYTQQVEVTNLFVFNFHGEIIHAAINFPGSWHDTRLAGLSGLYYPKLSDTMTPPGMAILGDSAFVNNTKCTNGKIIRARKPNETRNIPEPKALAAIDLIMQRIMPSERQSAEWGTSAIKGPFGRLKATLTTDSNRRAIIIDLAVRLINFKTRTMGRNQIANTYISCDQ